jgi:hypothetical protein
MSADRLQTQRFEVKYLVSESTAQLVRDYVRSYLQPDEFAANLPDNSYPVHSLYLDSADLATYQAVQLDHKNRFKLRIRYYQDDSEVVFFEIKRRTTETISKQRARVRRAAVGALLGGRLPGDPDLAAPDAKQRVALEEFCRLVRALDAQPKSHVAYRREAWMSPVGNSIRITFDRDVRCEAMPRAELTTRFRHAVVPFGSKVVVEMKFTDRLPEWCRDLARAFGLVRRGAPKYAAGVTLIGEDRLAPPGTTVTPPARRSRGSTS